MQVAFAGFDENILEERHLLKWLILLIFFVKMNKSKYIDLFVKRKAQSKLNYLYIISYAERKKEIILFDGLLKVKVY